MNIRDDTQERKAITKTKLAYNVAKVIMGIVAVCLSQFVVSCVLYSPLFMHICNILSRTMRLEGKAVKDTSSGQSAVI